MEKKVAAYSLEFTVLVQTFCWFTSIKSENLGLTLHKDLLHYIFFIENTLYLPTKMIYSKSIL